MGISSLATKYQFENFGVKWRGTRTNAQITTVVVHHQAGTNFDNMPEVWRNIEASAHYGIGPDGTIRAYIDENKTAWHANGANSYAIGIECTNITGAPDWKVAEKTIDSLVKLIQDIETRLGKKVDIIGHRDAPGAATACPGPFLYPRLGEIRNRVNGASSGGSTPNPTPTPNPAPTYNVEPWNVRQTVTTDVLNVRAAQNTSSAIVRQLKRGNTFNATRITRNGENVNGFTTWFEVDGVGWVSGALVTPVANNPAPTPQPQLKGSDLPNSGSYTFPVNTNIRAAASTSSAVVGMYNAGQTVNYDSKVTAGGYVWLSWIGGSGNRRYSAVV